MISEIKSSCGRKGTKERWRGRKSNGRQTGTKFTVHAYENVTMKHITVYTN